MRSGHAAPLAPRGDVRLDTSKEVQRKPSNKMTDRAGPRGQARQPRHKCEIAIHKKFAINEPGAQT